MDLENIIKTMCQTAGISGNKMSKILGITQSSYSLWIRKPMQQVLRLVKICDVCGFKIIITNNKNITFDLSEIIDLPDKKNKQNQDK